MKTMSPTKEGVSQPTAGPEGSSAGVAPSQRLLSLDALRGFDMFWIVGAEDIVHSLHKISQRGAVGFLTNQMEHKQWGGVTFYDLIFPLFVYIVGVSIVFSLSRSLRKAGKATTIRRILVRSALLFVIGILYYGGVRGGVAQIRLLGVLQRIALCYLFASLAFCFLRLRGMVLLCAALLIGYWGLLTFWPVPGHGAADFAEGANLTNYIDSQYLPFRKWDGDHDPEGLLSTLPAIGTCLLGVFAGMLLSNAAIPDKKKVLYLAIAGVAGVLLGFLWGVQFPVIKKIWTSSYVLVAGGYSCLFLAAFYQIIELWQYRRWATPFVWIGVNPITIYLAHNIIDFRKLAIRFVGGPIEEALGNYGDLLITCCIMAMSFLLVRFLYQRKLFLRL